MPRRSRVISCLLFNALVISAVLRSGIPAIIFRSPRLYSRLLIDRAPSWPRCKTLEMKHRKCPPVHGRTHDIKIRVAIDYIRRSAHVSHSYVLALCVTRSRNVCFAERLVSTRGACARAEYAHTHTGPGAGGRRRISIFQRANLA